MSNMGNKSALFVLLLGSVSVPEITTFRQHPDVGFNIKELVPKYGYPFETHTISTQDDYILELHRIPHGKYRGSKNRNNKPVVLLMQGLLSSTDVWINVGPQGSLGYLLADSGYDVWLGNHRGTTWSRRHLTLDPFRDGEQFWDFSYHEMGIYDNAAFIDYILDTTEQKSLVYIGHSEGTTSFFAMASVFPEYNRKIRLMIGLAPIAYLSDTKMPLVDFLIPFKESVWSIMKRHNVYGFLMHSNFVTLAGEVLCSDDAITQDICAYGFSLAGGFNDEQQNKTLLPVIFSSSPAGASWKQVSHYLQGIESGDFRQFDYEKNENYEIYGQTEPPAYNLSQVTAPVALYFGNNDYWSTDKNVWRTRQALPNVVSFQLVEGFNHFDFLWAKDVVPLLYKDVLKLMQRFKE